jgi:hypothetical protein
VGEVVAVVDTAAAVAAEEAVTATITVVEMAEAVETVVVDTTNVGSIFS